MEKKLTEGEIIGFLSTLEHLDKDQAIEAGLSLACSLFLDTELASAFKVLKYITSRFTEEDITEVLGNEPGHLNTLVVIEKIISEAEKIIATDDNWQEYLNSIHKGGVQ